ncbi:MAG: MerR family transcriptional regulator [Clostridia bacterium]|nr:MerR family transcriptional regulator [Clostridia bacterium]
MQKYTTGELAKLCGVSVRTVQYYDTRGIVSPSELSEGGRRLYTEADLSKMKTVCFLRELDLPLGTVAEIIKEENSGEVISLILGEQMALLQNEIEEKQKNLEKLSRLRRMFKENENLPLEAINDAASIMESKKKMKKLHAFLIATGLPIEVAELVSVALWISTGIWWPFAVYLLVAVPYAVWITRYYFTRVAYVCPECHGHFRPSLREAFWANHTPTTRKLTCPHCGKKSFCVEIYDENHEKKEEE